MKTREIDSERRLRPKVTNRLEKVDVGRTTVVERDDDLIKGKDNRVTGVRPDVKSHHFSNSQKRKKKTKKTPLFLCAYVFA